MRASFFLLSGVIERSESLQKSSLPRAVIGAALEPEECDQILNRWAALLTGCGCASDQSEVYHENMLFASIVILPEEAHVTTIFGGTHCFLTN